jgi:predicted dehydrogenase
MAYKSNRRDFLKTSAAVGAGFWVAGRATWADELKSTSPNEKLNVACIGVGGKGDSDSDQVGKHANVIAVCDIDDDQLDKKVEKYKKENKFPDIQRFNDYRKMYDALGSKIDIVTVSTPDHNHAAASMLAIKLGKGVYCQKPMTHTVYEARQIRLAAHDAKVATQLGNQGTASPELRRGVEVIRAGALGNVTEVHVWTNRPIWPQAPKIMARPNREDPVPPTIHWDEWIGPAPMRPYVGNRTYEPFNWRGWWDFGTGALGDMGCHTANMPFMALKLGYPSSVVAECGDLNPETYPSWATIHYEFPARGDLPPVKLTWWEGHKPDGKKNQPPDELFQGQKINDSGSLAVGDKGTMYSPHDYGGKWMLLPEAQYKGYKDPEPTLPRNPEGGDEGQKMEWIAAAKGGPAAMANFDYGGKLTEFLMLGNIAIRASGTAPGKKLEWNGEDMKFPNYPEAEKWLKYDYRKGWTL